MGSMVVRWGRLRLLGLLMHCNTVSFGLNWWCGNLLPERICAAFVLLGRSWWCASSAGVGTIIRPKSWSKTTSTTVSSSSKSRWSERGAWCRGLWSRSSAQSSKVVNTDSVAVVWRRYLTVLVGEASGVTTAHSHTSATSTAVGLRCESLHLLCCLGCLGLFVNLLDGLWTFVG